MRNFWVLSKVASIRKTFWDKLSKWYHSKSSYALYHDRDWMRILPVTWLEEQSERQRMQSHRRRPMINEYKELASWLVPELHIPRWSVSLSFPAEILGSKVNQEHQYGVFHMPFTWRKAEPDDPGRFSLEQYKYQEVCFCLGTYRGPEQSIKTMFNSQPMRPVPMTFGDFRYSSVALKWANAPAIKMAEGAGYYQMRCGWLGRCSETCLHRLHDELLLYMTQDVSIRNVQVSIIAALRDMSSSIIILFNMRKNSRIEHDDKPSSRG
jgi:hypothetical protein